MSDPLSTGSTFDDAPDQGLDDAAAALESQLPPGVAESISESPAAPAPQQQARPGRDAWHSQWRGERRAGYLKRLENERRQAASLAAEKKRYQEQLDSNARTMESVKALLAKQFPQDVEKIDLLEPGAADRLAELLQGRTDAALKPLLAWVEKQQQLEAQQAEQAELQAFQEEMQARITEEYRSDIREYSQASPYAHGVEDRVRSWIGYRTEVYQRAGWAPEDAQAEALKQVHQVFERSRAQGFNGVEGVDQFITAEMAALGLDPVDPEDDLDAVWGGQQQPAAPPAPRTEAGRLRAVQDRTRGAAATGPRAPERVSTDRGELEALVQAGETDMRRLQAAALQDAGGDGAQAALLLSRAFAMPLQW